MKWDAQLLEGLRQFSEPNTCQLKRFYGLKILPKTTKYVGEIVPQAEHSIWHDAAVKKLASVDHVFLDPDNGLEVKSATRKRLPKYTFYDEISDYVASGVAVTCIQFARQCSPETKAFQVREACMKASGINNNLPVLRGRASPNILFISLAPKDKAADLTHAINSFAEGAPPMDRKGARITVID